MSKEMREYLAAYLAWVEAGATTLAGPFSRHYGLCSNASLHTFDSHRAYERVSRELSEMFAADGLHPDYPFGGEFVYGEAQQNGTQHLNPHRLAWIYEQLNRPE